jgi:DNA helicase IV
MELGMIERRSVAGSMTILGDLAQSTGAWAHDSWDEVVEHLQMEFPYRIAELEYGYRVPTQIYEYAAQLLPLIGASVAQPKVVREGPADPERIETIDDNVGDEVVDAAKRYLTQGLNIGVICPAVYRENVEDAFKRHRVEWADAKREGISAPVSIIEPLDSKGLEFDATIVVEPVAIAGEIPFGERLLYVALTRSTRYLTVVHTGVELPVNVTPMSGTEPPRPATKLAVVPDAPTDRRDRMAAVIAGQIAADIKSTLKPELWEDVLAEVQRLLDEDDRTSE